MYAALYPNDAMPTTRRLLAEAAQTFYWGMRRRLSFSREPGNDSAEEIRAIYGLGKYVESVTAPLSPTICNVFNDSQGPVVTGWMDTGDGIAVVLRPGQAGTWYFADNHPRALEDLPEPGSRRYQALTGAKVHGHALAAAQILQRSFAKRFPTLGVGQAN